MTSQSVVLTVHNKAHYLDEFRSGPACRHSECRTDRDRRREYGRYGNILQAVATPSDRTDDVWETIANNAGMKLASGDYVAIVQDDDLIVEQSWLDRCIDQMEAHDIGILGGRGVGHFYFGVGAIGESAGEVRVAPESPQFAVLSGFALARMSSIPFWPPSMTRLDVSVVRTRPRSTAPNR